MLVIEQLQNLILPRKKKPFSDHLLGTNAPCPVRGSIVVRQVTLHHYPFSVSWRTYRFLQAVGMPIFIIIEVFGLLSLTWESRRDEQK